MPPAAVGRGSLRPDRYGPIRSGNGRGRTQNLVYGIDADAYRLETGEVGSTRRWAKDSRRIRHLGPGGRPARPQGQGDLPAAQHPRRASQVHGFIHEDSLYAPIWTFLRNLRPDYVVFGFHDNDSVSIRKDVKPCTLRRTKKSAVITSSLWGAIMEHDLPYALAAEMEEIYQWTVDFFGIQKGDSFTVIYDERFIDDTSRWASAASGAQNSRQSGKEYYAIPFRQGGKIQYWEADGASLRKQLLKAPLKYSRASVRALHLRPQAPDIQGLPAPHGRRLRRTEGHARACRGRWRRRLQRAGAVEAAIR